jgi:hypothetical protein
MTLTVEQLKQWFRQYNDAYFGSVLPMPALRLSKARTRLGTMSCRCERRLFRRRYYDFTISVSTYYESTEREYQNVLLHEMIHYYIAFKGIRDTLAHGREFHRIMLWLNQEYGWNISVSSPQRGKTPDASRTYNDDYVVLALTTRTGEHYLSVVNPKHVQLLDRQARSVQKIAQHKWFKSHDSYFRTFPKVRTLRGRRVSKEVYEEKLRTMDLMVL